MDVGTADAGCVYPDADLSRTWLRVRDVAGFERLPDGRHHVCFHFLSFCLLNRMRKRTLDAELSPYFIPICSGIDESSIKNRQYLARRTLIGLRARGKRRPRGPNA